MTGEEVTMIGMTEGVMTEAIKEAEVGGEVKAGEVERTTTREDVLVIAPGSAMIREREAEVEVKAIERKAEKGIADRAADQGPDRRNARKRDRVTVGLQLALHLIHVHEEFQVHHQHFLP